MITALEAGRGVGTFDVSAGGDSSEHSIPTLKNCTIRIGGAWDTSVAASSLNAELEAAYGVAKNWIYGPGGSTASTRKFSGSGFITDLSIPADVGGGVEWSATIQVTGDVTVGVF